MVFDIAIVGAGPAGSAAAIEASRRGMTVALVDRTSFPRDKTCGDGLTTNALRLIQDLGIEAKTLAADSDFGYRSVRDITLRSPSGRQVELTLPPRGDFAAIISRRVLDAKMFCAARHLATFTRDDFQVDSIERHTDHISLRSGQDSIAARWVVAADGHFSTVRKLTSAVHRPDLGEWHAVRQYHENVNATRLHVLFEPDLLPGYAWVFPLPNGHANVGFGVLRKQGRTGKELKALWPVLLERPSVRSALGPNARPVESVRAWPIPTRYEPDRMAGDRILFAGDAAGVVDPMTGEGIAQAIETGMLAARAIAGGGNIESRYRQAVHDAIGRDLRFAAMLSKIMERTLFARAALRTIDTNNWTRSQFGRWMFEDYPRAALFTPNRWHLMASRPGTIPA